jgi:hypothetical protein
MNCVDREKGGKGRVKLITRRNIGEQFFFVLRESALGAQNPLFHGVFISLTNTSLVSLLAKVDSIADNVKTLRTQRLPDCRTKPFLSCS